MNVESPTRSGEAAHEHRVRGELGLVEMLPMSADREVTIALTKAQVAEVLHLASGQAGPANVLSALTDFDAVSSVVLPLLDDARCSRSTLRAVLVLVAFPTNGDERELREVSKQLDLSPSITHRYISTWVAVGLLEQDPRSRRYRRAPSGDTRGNRARTVGDDSCNAS